MTMKNKIIGTLLMLPLLIVFGYCMNILRIGDEGLFFATITGFGIVLLIVVAVYGYVLFTRDLNVYEVQNMLNIKELTKVRSIIDEIVYSDDEEAMDIRAKINDMINLQTAWAAGNNIRCDIHVVEKH